MIAQLSFPALQPTEFATIPRGIDADVELDVRAERALMRRYAAGGRSLCDRAAVVEAYLPSIRRILGGLIRRRRWRSTVDELLGAATLAALRALDAYVRRPRDRRFGAYLQGAVRRACIDVFRADASDGVELLADHEPTAETDPCSMIGDADSFRRRLHSLRGDERALIVRRFADGLSIDETAAALGVSPDAARRLQSQALAALRMQAARDAAA